MAIRFDLAIIRFLIIPNHLFYSTWRMVYPGYGSGTVHDKQSCVVTFLNYVIKQGKFLHFSGTWYHGV